jgi:uncharacterized protein
LGVDCNAFLITEIQVNSSVSSLLSKFAFVTVLDKHIDDINKLCTTYKVKQLYAFGSVLTNKFNTDSDIDLIVDFEPIDLIQYADNYYDLKFSLEDVLQKPVDLLEEKAIKNPYFREVVNKQRQLIYGR